MFTNHPNKGTLSSFVIFILAGFLLYGTATAQTPQNASSFLAASAGEKSGFMENKGQFADQDGKSVPNVFFRSSINQVDLLVTDYGLSFNFFKPVAKGQDHLLKDDTKILGNRPEKYDYDFTRTILRLEGAQIKKENIRSEQPTAEGVFNFYKSNCPQGVLGVRKYNKITISEVYPGIDWVLYSTDKGMKYDFVVHPGADVSQIKLKYDGLADVEGLNNNSSLRVKNPLGELNEGEIFSYQKESNKKINTRFQINENKISFWVGDYDNTETLVIDPPLYWGTYFGGNATAGSGNGQGFDITMNYDGTKLFVSGHSNDIPVLSLGGAYYQGTVTGQTDTYVGSFTSAGVQLWTTYYGSLGDDYGWGVAARKASNILYLIGETHSTATLPLLNKGGAYNQAAAATWCSFIVEFDAAGARTWATLYGEPTEIGGTTVLRSAVCDASDNLYTVGYTIGANNTLLNAGGTSFYKGPHSDASDPTVSNRQWDGLILKFNSSDAMTWGTLWGADDSEVLNSCTIDGNGDFYVIGQTTTSDLSAASQLVNPGGGAYFKSTLETMDAVVLKFTGASNQLTWATYFGGTSNEHGYDINTDVNRDVYIVGYSDALGTSAKDLGSGAYYQSTPSTNGGKEGYIARFSSAGVQEWGTLYGGGNATATMRDDYFTGIVTNNANDVYVYGHTSCPNFPVANAYQSTKSSAASSTEDFVVLGFTSSGIRKFSSFVGGTGREFGHEGGCTIYGPDNCLYWIGESNSYTGGGGNVASPTYNPGGGGFYQSNKNGSGYETMIYHYCPVVSGAITSTTAVVCNGASTGAATVTAYDGQIGYTYSWNPGGQTTATATGLASAVYTVTITDGGGATTTVTVSITQPSAIVPATAVTNIDCNGNSTGSITASATGGAGSYTYLWTTGATTATITGLGVNTYTVTVTDASGCTKTKTAAITQPAVLTASISASTNILCFGVTTGAATAAGSGGTTSYSYSWSNGKTTATMTGIGSGTYTVTITDNRSCTATTTVQLTQPASALASSTGSITNVNCNGNTNGAVTASASGGTTNYSYSWNTGATTANLTGVGANTYTITITDANLCTNTATAQITQPAVLTTADITQTRFCNNWSTSTSASGGTSAYTYTWYDAPASVAETGATLNSIASTGTYTVIVADNNGCTTSKTTTITNVNWLATTWTMSNAACGISNGTATALPAGGITPYTYSWNTGATTVTASNLTPGTTYTVTVTDAALCTATVTATVGQNVGPTAFASLQTNVSCFGAATGQATSAAVLGTPAYSYSWSGGGGSNSTATGLIAGTYTVTISDQGSCTSTATVSITQPASALTTSTGSIANVNCFGNTTGSATASAGGGTTNYSYSWNTGSTNPVLSGVGANTYTLTVTDANACTKTATAVITQPAAGLTASTGSITNINCFGNTTGSATANVSGGTTNYSYSWNTGATTSVLNGVGSNTYTVTITDANLCTKTATAVITQPAAALSASTGSITNVNCFGNTTGSATANVSGGTTNYSYSWNTGATTSVLSGVGSNTYTVTITDANLCTTTSTAVITQPSAVLAAGISASANVNCYNAGNGSATVGVTGGTTNYSYSWTDGSTTAAINGLIPNNYTVTVTDANACTQTASVQITQPTDIAVILGSTTDAPCGQNTGAATVAASGGTGGLSYSWNSGATIATATGLLAGNYTVTVTDGNLCTKTLAVAINSINGPTASIASVNNVLCRNENTGTATASLAGGTTPFTYSWNNGQTTATATGLANGSYTVTVTDANSCVSNVSVSITQPAAVLNVLTPDPTHVWCFGGNNGVALAVGIGGTTTYSYSWNNGATTASISNLSAAIYTVTVTDANNCTASKTVEITQPAAPLAAVVSSQTNVNCFGNGTGEATASVSGGTTGYAYSWSNGATTIGISNINSGTYTLTVTDNKACSTTASVTITQPSAGLTSIANATSNVDCFGNANGSADVTVSGGTTGYSYSWNNNGTTAAISGLSSGTYSVLITDANGCTSTASTTITQPGAVLTSSVSASTNVDCFNNNTGAITLTVNGGTTNYSYSWNNGVTTVDQSNIPAGIYNVQVTDANGCTTTSSITITQPSAALASAINTYSHISCYGAGNGTAQTDVTGGTTNYLYSWSNGGTDNTISNLIPGTYNVNITDGHGCTTSASVILTQPPVLDASISAFANALCGQNNGSATALAAGGVTAYSYSWSNGETTASVSGLAAAIYTLTVADFNGCTKSVVVPILSINGPAVTSTGLIDIKCFGDNSGSATASITGGTTPYTYSWQNGQTGITATGLSSGSYSVLVTDANNCIGVTTVTLTQPSSVVGVNILDPSSVSCNGGSNGSATAMGTGGTTSYSYSWSNGATTNAVTGLTAAVYTVTVTDAHSCTVSKTVNISEPAAAVFASISSQNDVKCFGLATGSAAASAAGGTSGYTYSWSNGVTSAVISNINSGTYTVTVTDTKGCTDTEAVAISQPANVLDISINGVANVLCFGDYTGTASAGATGGTTNYSYSWSNGSTDASLSGLNNGVYTVTVIDANQCSKTASVTLTQPVSPLDAGIGAVTHIKCFGNSTGSITTNIFGGTSGYSYSWSNGATTANISDIAAGTYSVVISDANNCKATVTTTLSEPTAGLTSSVNSQSDVNCYGAATGSAVVTPVGGTSPYGYVWTPAGGQSAGASGLTAGTYTVNIIDANGCTNTVTTTITEPIAPLKLNAVASKAQCYGDQNGALQASTFGGTTSYSYSWSNGATTASVSNVGAGTYTVTITDGNGCTETVSAAVTQPAAPVDASFTYDPTNGNIPLDVNFTNTSTGTFYYSWSFGDGGSSSETNPTYTYNSVNTFTIVLTALNENGCIDTAMAVVDAKEPADVTIPNVFTPNADGSNDIFTVLSTGLEDLHCDIYDRWGLKIFEFDGVKGSWDGHTISGGLAPDGTYYYIIEATSYSTKKFSYQGYIQLIR